jgi:hypothetical protein
MSRMKTALGLGLLSALCLCAFGASSASAMTAHECKQSEGGTGGITYSAGCTTQGAGGWQKVPIAGTPSVSFTGTSSFTLSATVAGVKFTITCTGQESENATLGNSESGGEMIVSGEGISRFTGCSVTAPVGKGCDVPVTITTVNLTSTTAGGGALMGAKFTPKLGEEFVTIPVTNCTVEALNGTKVVKGAAKSETKTNLTQAFTTTSGSSLTFGGQTATFTGELHVTTTDGTPLLLETP